MFRVAFRAIFITTFVSRSHKGRTATFPPFCHLLKSLRITRKYRRTRVTITDKYLRNTIERVINKTSILSDGNFISLLLQFVANQIMYPLNWLRISCNMVVHSTGNIVWTKNFTDFDFDPFTKHCSVFRSRLCLWSLSTYRYQTVYFHYAFCWFFYRMRIYWRIGENGLLAQNWFRTSNYWKLKDVKIVQ